MEAGYRELKRFGKTQKVKMVEAAGTTGRYHTRKAKKYQSGVEKKL